MADVSDHRFFNGKRIDREYAENRVRWEPLYEATQIKGDGETIRFFHLMTNLRTSSAGTRATSI